MKCKYGEYTLPSLNARDRRESPERVTPTVSLPLLSQILALSLTSWVTSGEVSY